jgi:hypothetical protein
MSLRPTYIPITKEIRDKIKTLKRELTYVQFLSELLKKRPENIRSQGNPKVSIKGSKLK